MAIGTMVPDIAGYYPALLDYNATHSIGGVMTHCVPIGVIFYYVYQAFLKQPLFDLFPDAVTSRLRPWIDHPIKLTPSAVVAVTACVALGAMTHVIWDAFTHSGGWGVAKYPELTEIVYRDASRRPIRRFDVIQHTSSLLLVPMSCGFLIWLRTLPRHDDLVERARIPKGIAWFLVTLIIAGGAVYFQNYLQNHPDSYWIMVLTRSVKGGVAYLFALFLVYALGMNVLWWRDRVRASDLIDPKSFE